MKLFGVIRNEIHEEAQIWLIHAENIMEARTKFYHAMREEKIPPVELVAAPDQNKGIFQLWEIKFDENDVSFNDWKER